MALKQIVPIEITLIGDGSSTVFTFPLANMYQNGPGNSIPITGVGVVPGSIAIGGSPPVAVTSATIDSNGNITITLTSALGSNVQATFEVDLYYTSGAISTSTAVPATIIGGVYTSTNPTLTTGQTNAFLLNSAGALRIDGTATTQPVSGTVTANAGTGTFTTSDNHAYTIGSTTSGQSGFLKLGAVTTSAPSYTTAQSAPLSLTTAGALRVDATGTTQPVSGNVTDIPATSGGWSTAIAQALSNTATAVKASAGQLGGYAIFNASAATAYVFFYNSTTPTVGSTTNLIYQIGIPAGAAANVEFGKGIAFSTAIYVAASSSPTTSAAPGTALTVTTLYK